MKYYFKLQSTRLIRWSKNMGLNPYLGLILGLLIFLVFSKVLYYKTEYANWIYSAIIISLIFNLSDVKRNSLLINSFESKKYYLIRIIENSLIALPFHIYLLFEKEFLVAFLFIPIVIVFAFINSNQQWSKTTPTPFKKLPFEFIIGFRKTFWLIAIAYFLIFKAIQVENYNLGLAGLGLIFLTSMSYYQKPEAEYFVWIHTDRTKLFLKLKFLVALICVSILSGIPLIAMIVYFSSNWLTTVMVYLVACIFLGSMIVAKYSAYPYEMNIPQAIFYALSLLFPPMLPVAIGIFYSQSKKRLEPILEC